MLSIAVAALAIAGPAKKMDGYLLPLYDLVTSVSNYSLTANFCTSADWSQNNSWSNFKVFVCNGNTSQFSPNGSWTDITQYCNFTGDGNEFELTYTFSTPNPRGTLWVQYAGGSSDSINGAETSVVAAQFGASNQAGHGSLPGSIVPIIKSGEGTVQNFNFNVSFAIDAPWGGSWDGNGPSFWANTGLNNSPLPGNGWQNLNTSPVQPTLGAPTVLVQIHPNSNIGYYCIGVVETYVPSQDYNPHNNQWTEFSAVIRPMPTS